MELGRIKKKQDDQRQTKLSSNNASKANNSSGGNKTSGTSSRSAVRDSIFYQDDRNMSVSEAFSTLTKNSLFSKDSVGSYRNRMEKAVTNLQKNESWTVSMDTDGDGEYEDVKLLDAIASSFDSELDLYIQDKVEQIMRKYGSCSKQYLSQKALDELKSYGIVVESVGGSDKNCNRVYSFSLVDSDGNVLTDANGKKGSIIFGDCLIPDGYAQGAEVQLASILDCMGYDCITKADFIGREDEYQEVLLQIQENINNGLYEGQGNTGSIYGNIKDIMKSVSDLWGGHGSVPGGSPDTGSDAGQETVDEQTEKTKQTSEYMKKLNKEISKYKDEHGEEPTGAALRMIESSVQRELGLSNAEVLELK